MIPLFELEPHREAEDDPRWKTRVRTRNIIMISAALIVPLGVLMITAGLILGDMDFAVSRPNTVMMTAMVHPFLAAFTVLGAMYIHHIGAYWSAAVLALGTQVINFGVFLFSTILWLLT